MYKEIISSPPPFHTMIAAIGAIIGLPPLSFISAASFGVAGRRTVSCNHPGCTCGATKRPTPRQSWGRGWTVSLVIGARAFRAGLGGQEFFSADNVGLRPAGWSTYEVVIPVKAVHVKPELGWVTSNNATQDRPAHSRERCRPSRRAVTQRAGNRRATAWARYSGGGQGGCQMLLSVEVEGRSAAE